MQKNILIGIIALIFIIASVNAVECSHNIPIDNIPCEIISPNDILSSDNCTTGNYNYSITDLNTSLNVQNGSMLPKYGGNYNFSFLQNETWHSYRVWICDGSTQDFNIILNDTSGWELGIIIALLIVSFAFAYISMETKPNNLVNTAISMLFFFISLYILIFITGILKILTESILSGKTMLEPLTNLIDTGNTILIYLFWILIIYYLINMTKEAVMFWQDKKYRKW